MSREALIQAVADQDKGAFVKIRVAHERKDDDFNMYETIECLSGAQIEQLWNGLQDMTMSALFSFSIDTEDDEAEQELKEASEVLLGVVLVAMATIKQKDVSISDPLLDSVGLLHSVLNSLPSEMVHLRRSIGQLGEVWWTKNIRGRETIAVPSIRYHLEKSVQPKVAIADIKRVYSLRECLREVQLDNASSQTIKDLMHQAVCSPVYVRSDEGRKFLSFLFSLSAGFIEDLHASIKSVIPTCSASLLPEYGHVYFKAWKNASTSPGPILQKLEEKCLQDLMYKAVHVKRGGVNSMANRLMMLLRSIHEQTHDHAVREMLLRLYEPFIWRSLKVPNSIVRNNAAVIFFDVFPLDNPGASAVESDEIMQKQFNIIQTLLDDPVVAVRSCAVRGVGTILSGYWEVVPRPMILNLLQKLLQDLVWDASSPDVRVAVLQTVGHILSNPLSHPILKDILPELSSMLHDTSESVRLAFIDLLITIKPLKIIKYFHVAGMDHILARLEIDSSSVGKKIVKLVMPTFLPLNKPLEDQLERIIRLIEKNRGAARKFFCYAYSHMDPTDTVKLILNLARCVFNCVAREEGKRDNSRNEENTVEEDDEEVDIVSAKNINVMAGLLDGIAILWQSLRVNIKDSDLNAQLHKRMSACLPKLFQYFEDLEIRGQLIYLAGFIPPKQVPTFSRSLLSKLRGLDDDPLTDSELYSPLIDALLEWNMTADLLELIADWLEVCLTQTNDKQKSIRRSGAAKKGVRFNAPVQSKPNLGILYLRYITNKADFRDTVLEKHRDELITILTLLKDILKSTELRMKNGSQEDSDEVLTDEVIGDLFEQYLRIAVLMHQHGGEQDVIVTMNDIVKWTSQMLLPALRQKRQHKRRLLTQSETTMMGSQIVDGTMNATEGATLNNTLLSRTLRKGSEQDQGSSDLALQLCKSVLMVCSDMCLLGLGNYNFVKNLADFTVLLLTTEDSIHILSEISHLMYQITELILSKHKQRSATAVRPPGGEDEEQEEEEAMRSDMVPQMLTKVLSMLVMMVKTRRELAERILPTLKPALTQMLYAYYGNTNLDMTHRRDIMSIICTGLMHEMHEHIKKDNYCGRVENINGLPTLPAFLLTIISKRAVMTQLFLDEIFTMSDVGAVSEIEQMLGMMYLLDAFMKSKADKGNLKDCVLSLQTRFEELDAPHEDDEDSPYKFLHATTRSLITDVMTAAGMVA